APSSLWRDTREVHILSFRSAGVGSARNPAGSLSAASRSKIASSSIGGITIPPLLEHRSRTCKNALDRFFAASGFCRHFPGAPPLPIPPKQDDAVDLWQTFQHLFGFSAQPLVVEGFFQSELNGWLFSLSLLRQGLAQPAAIVVLHPVTGNSQQPGAD